MSIRKCKVDVRLLRNLKQRKYITLLCISSSLVSSSFGALGMRKSLFQINSAADFYYFPSSLAAFPLWNKNKRKQKGALKATDVTGVSYKFEIQTYNTSVKCWMKRLQMHVKRWCWNPTSVLFHQIFNMVCNLWNTHHICHRLIK